MAAIARRSMLKTGEAGRKAKVLCNNQRAVPLERSGLVVKKAKAVKTGRKQIK